MKKNRIYLGLMVLVIMTFCTTKNPLIATFEKSLTKSQLETIEVIEDVLKKLLMDNLENDGNSFNEKEKVQLFLHKLVKADNDLILAKEELVRIKLELEKSGLWRDLVTIQKSHSENEIEIFDGKKSDAVSNTEVTLNLHGQYFRAIQEIGLSNKIAANYFEAVETMTLITNKDLAQGLLYDIEKYGYNGIVVKRILAVNLIINELLKME